MNYSKLDSSLTKVCNNISNSSKKQIDVFIQSVKTLSQNEIDLLSKSGINIHNPNLTILTGILSKDEIDFFSEKDWIKLISFSNKSKLLE